MVNGKNAYGAYVGFAPFEIILGFKAGKIDEAYTVGVGSPGSIEESVILKACLDLGIDPRMAK
jgi:hypothetical protein